MFRVRRIVLGIYNEDVYSLPNPYRRAKKPGGVEVGRGCGEPYDNYFICTGQPLPGVPPNRTNYPVFVDWLP
ncbi:MAG: hypothetical protein DMG25_05640 [Acidobacteria bacterium]|nr:MAG: hypothetical protein DMG25_05640 [Acidobacteriota bacterium]